MKYKKLLVIGFGSIARKHLSALEALNYDIEIKILTRKKNDSIFKNNYKKRLSFISKFSEGVTFNPDIILLSNPSSMRIKFLNHFFDKILFIEKPIFSTPLNKNTSLYRNLTASKNLHVGYNLLFDDSLQYLKKIIINKKFGDILYLNSIVGQNLSYWRDFNYKNSVSAHKKLGGGVLLELSHEINFLIEFFPDIKIEYARFGKLSNLLVNVEDFSQIFFKSKNTNIFLHLDFFRHDFSREIEFITNTSTIKWNYNDGTVNVYDQKISEFKTIYKRRFNNSYIQQWKYLFNCLEKKINFNNFLNSHKTIEVINKIKINKI